MSRCYMHVFNDSLQFLSSFIFLATAKDSICLAINFILKSYKYFQEIGSTRPLPSLWWSYHNSYVWNYMSTFVGNCCFKNKTTSFPSSAHLDIISCTPIGKLISKICAFLIFWYNRVCIVSLNIFFILIVYVGVVSGVENKLNLISVAMFCVYYVDGDYFFKCSWYRVYRCSKSSRQKYDYGKKS